LTYLPSNSHSFLHPRDAEEKKEEKKKKKKKKKRKTSQTTPARRRVPLEKRRTARPRTHRLRVL
jgi:hypothetical protein